MYMFKVNNGNNKVDNKDTRTTSLTSRHYSRAIWTSFYQFWVHVIWALELKILYICMKEKCKFFVNYDKWLQRSRNFHYEALETLKMLWLFSSVIMQNCECQDGCFKETKHAKFSEKRTFLILWFVHVFFQRFAMAPARVVHLDTTRGLTASHEPELHW